MVSSNAGVSTTPSVLVSLDLYVRYEPDASARHHSWLVEELVAISSIAFDETCMDDRGKALFKPRRNWKLNPCAVIYFVDPNRPPKALCQRDALARPYKYERRNRKQRGTPFRLEITFSQDSNTAAHPIVLGSAWLKETAALELQQSDGEIREILRPKTDGSKSSIKPGYGSTEAREPLSYGAPPCGLSRPEVT
jgi:hypothetical protein